MIETLAQDLRYAVRGLRKKPGFTIAVVLTLGLGIGANAAMFGIVDRLLFRAPSYLVDADRVNRVYLMRTFDGKDNAGGWMQYTHYKNLERWTTSFDVAVGMSESRSAVGVGDNARQLHIGPVSAGFWKLFNARPVIGRFFTAAEDTTPAGAAVAVLGYDFWQSRYGGQTSALGQQLKIGIIDYTIIGVAPPGFSGLSSGNVPVAYIPITTYADGSFRWDPKDLSNWYMKYNISWMQTFVRRKPGVSVETANADLTNAYKRSYELQRELGKSTPSAELTKPHAIAGPMLAERGPQAGEVSKVATWVSGVALVVMLIAAANVANLLLARALRRRREVAVRLALGVTRGRLLSQLLTESLLLSAIGGVVGLVLAQFGGAILRTQFLPTSEGVSVFGDGRTLLFAGAAVIVVGLLTGLAPAWQSGRGDLTTSLKSGAREGSYHKSKTRVALLVLQGALSVVLLIGAGLFVRSLGNVQGLRMGYDVDRLIRVDVDERGEKLTDAEKSALRYRLADAARALPGVEQASRAVTVPFSWTWDENIFLPGMDTAVINRMGSFRIQAAAPEYLKTMGTRLLRGRMIDDHDTEKAPKVLVVSQTMAKKLWPTTDALGQCVKVGSDTMPCSTVVGVAEDVRVDDFATDNLLYYYRPIDQAAPAEGGVFVRMRGDAAGASESVRRALQPLMPGASYVTVKPMSEIFAPNVASWRLGATMFVAFGALALVLAAIGLYSVIAYNVQQRTQELGVRVAFGAQVFDVVRLVLTEGLKLAVAGVVIGTGLALVAGRWVAPLLYQVNPTDPVVFVSVVVVLLVVATVASLVPALRAARVDPSVALRSE